MDVVASGVRALVRSSVRRGVRGVWLRGALPRGGAVIAVNHHSWWDGYVVGEVAWSLGKRPNVLMHEEQLARFAFFRRVGVLGAHELRPALRRLRAGEHIWVFPEGELRPAGPLGPLHPGAAWLAATARVPLVPVALRVVLRGHEHPEAYLRAGAPAHDLPSDLARQLAALDHDLATHHPEEPLPGYLRLTLGRVSAHERLQEPARLLSRLLRRDT